MNVKDLKEAIKNLPDDMLVVMSSDAEGNRLTTLEEVDGDNNRFIRYKGDWEGEIALKELRQEDKDRGFTEDEVDTDSQGVDAVVLWPLN
jgi:SpoU rRNA methylase family enzyme